MKITKGTFKVENYGHALAVEVTLPIGQEHTVVTNQFCHAAKFDGDALDNMELIAEAFNVANETGLSPRQILEQRNLLLQALKDSKQVLVFALENHCAVLGVDKSEAKKNTFVIEIEKLISEYSK